MEALIPRHKKFRTVVYIYVHAYLYPVRRVSAAPLDFQSSHTSLSRDSSPSNTSGTEHISFKNHPCPLQPPKRRAAPLGMMPRILIHEQQYAYARKRVPKAKNQLPFRSNAVFPFCSNNPRGGSISSASLARRLIRWLRSGTIARHLAERPWSLCISSQPQTPMQPYYSSVGAKREGRRQFKHGLFRE